ncbi:MAG: acyloxyacyl hydrolase [Alphaproteobacteria bacterium HGW-Alphaproteobacteria-3]|nr:MAG: acyloxyacyl hydrolase [Alphaproteobacteria bacterium HGW-Alphaproteobacteria-3]
MDNIRKDFEQGGSIVFLKRFALTTLAAAPFFCTSMPANAEGLLTELRIGVLDHDSDLLRERHETSDPDINLEARFASPDFLSWAFAPNPLIGANINTGDGTSLAYAGLGWTFFLTDGIFTDFTFGGAIHDGETNGPSADSRQYGCRLAFHESFSLGYSFDGHNAIMLGIDHMSNASLCDKNDGLTNLGIRYAYRF